jgi:5'-nucleotidase
LRRCIAPSIVRDFMRAPSFLVTNDDGIDSPGLAALARALAAHGDVLVVAPDSERSWIGKAISRRPITAESRNGHFPCPAWAVNGTPADCIQVGLGHLATRRIDVVVSGINLGSNAGLPLILSSGTVGGALEGALLGRHAVATSIRLTKADYAHLAGADGGPGPQVAAAIAFVAGTTAGFCSALARRRKTRRFLVHNLNFPPVTTADTPLVRTIPGHFRIGNLRAETAGAADGSRREFAFQFAVEDEAPGPRLTDRACLESGRASHSILDFGRLGVAATQTILAADDIEVRDQEPAMPSPQP